MKIVYTVTLDGKDYPVQWIDAAGIEHHEIVPIERDGVHSHIDLLHMAFRKQHPGATYLPLHKFQQHLMKVRSERQKLNVWKEWAI